MLRPLPFAAVILATLLAACDVSRLRPEAPDPGPRLNGNEIANMLFGNSLQAEWTEEGPLTVYFPEVGQMRGLRSHRYRDSGVWTIEDDALCGDWKNWWGALERCWHINRAGKAVTLTRADGSRAFQMSLTEGNPAGL